jgi:hypothetical protein
MVMWCRICGMMLGVREPYADWSVDRNTLCPICAEREHLITIEESIARAEREEAPVAYGAPD